MPQVTVVYWRDIPAQVIARNGRAAARAQLSERFEQAIDHCAMQVGSRDSDAYQTAWRRGDPYEVSGDAEEVAASEAGRLEAQFNADAITSLVANEGWAPGGSR